MNLNEKVQGLYKQINALRKRHDDEINELKEQLAASSTGFALNYDRALDHTVVFLT